MSSDTERMTAFYQTLIKRFGPQRWWPGETAFEVMVGAILTQNTAWSNVEKAIINLKKADMLDPHRLNAVEMEDLANRIRPAGYFNIKARRLKNLVNWLCEQCDGSIESLKNWSVDRLREELLLIKGVGRETADSIILYALEKPTFVVDAYTCRILVRHHCIDAECDYEMVKEYCESALPRDRQLYNEFHALIVRVGKEYCRPRPRCRGCPLEKFDHTTEL